MLQREYKPFPMHWVHRILREGQFTIRAPDVDALEFKFAGWSTECASREGVSVASLTRLEPGGVPDRIPRAGSFVVCILITHTLDDVFKPSLKRFHNVKRFSHR